MCVTHTKIGSQIMWRNVRRELHMFVLNMGVLCVEYFIVFVHTCSSFCETVCSKYTHNLNRMESNLSEYLNSTLIIISHTRRQKYCQIDSPTERCAAHLNLSHDYNINFFFWMGIFLPITFQPKITFFLHNFSEWRGQ